jgi:hypothetical protein
MGRSFLVFLAKKAPLLSACMAVLVSFYVSLASLKDQLTVAKSLDPPSNDEQGKAYSGNG